LKILFSIHILFNRHQRSTSSFLMNIQEFTYFMNNQKLRLILLFIIATLLQLNVALAQESILSDVSYLYMEKLVATAKANYPRIKTYSARTTIAKNTLSQQKSSWLDPFSFSYIFRSNSNAIDLINPELLRGYQFGISVSPGQLLRKPYAIKNAKEDIKLSILDQEEYELTLESEVKRRYLLYLQALNILQLQSKMLIDIQSTFQASKIKYERNEITLQEYNQNAVELNTIKASKIEAEATMAIAKISLEELTVKSLEQIK